MAKQVEPYKCAFSISNEILSSCASIAFKLGRLSLTQETKAGVEDFATATKYSLALEDVEVKPSQMRGLSKGEDVPSAPIATALSRLYAKMPRIDPYDPSFLQEFEQAIWPEGTPNRLSRKIASFPYVIPMHARIEPLMKGLYSFASSGRGKIHPLALSCLFFFEIYAIMPYSQYNGVLARYMLKAFLGEYSANLYCLPIERLIFTHKEGVDEAFAASVEKADTAPLVSYLLHLIEEGVDFLLRHSSKKAPEQSPAVKKLLAVMEPGIFYSAAELCARLGLKSRLGLQKNYLKPALEAHAIEMSNPLTRTDRTQRYRRT